MWAAAAACVWGWFLYKDKMVLKNSVIRFHVVANSDSEQDQRTKLNVRDAVMKELGKRMEGITDIDQAKEALRENLPMIRELSNDTLSHLGVDMEAAVTLCQEAFDTRVYDSFTLPAGVYNALRITIGEGAGKNWWCVVFPAFCMEAASETFEEQAVSAGFTEDLAETVSEPETYKVRFFFLDKLGELENIFFSG